MDDQTGDSGRLLVRQIPVHDAVEVADGNRAVDIDRTIRLLAHARHGDVVLVGDVADDFFQKAIVLGPEVADWRSVDLVAARGTTIVAGEARGEGRGGDVMGHPLNALAWLASHLATRGKHLKAGDIVLTGSVVIATPIGEGDEAICRLEGLGEARLSLT